MKLLKQYHDQLDAEAMSKKLENKGIVTHISSKKSHSISSHQTGAIKVGLWVIFDNQYQDAVSYISNPKHKIKSGISSEEIQKIKKQAKISTYNTLNKFIAYAFIGVLVVALITYLGLQKQT